MDFMVVLPEVRGWDSIYIITDRLSEYAQFVPLSSSVTAEGMAQLFATNVWKLHGFPRIMIAKEWRPQSVGAF